MKLQLNRQQVKSKRLDGVIVHDSVTLGSDVPDQRKEGFSRTVIAQKLRIVLRIPIELTILSLVQSFNVPVGVLGTQEHREKFILHGVHLQILNRTVVVSQCLHEGAHRDRHLLLLVADVQERHVKQLRGLLIHKGQPDALQVHEGLTPVKFHFDLFFFAFAKLELAQPLNFGLVVILNVSDYFELALLSGLVYIAGALVLLVI